MLPLHLNKTRPGWEFEIPPGASCFPAVLEISGPLEYHGASLMAEFGLIGTITSDRILYDDGRFFRMLGGVLYQAAVLCGLDENVRLFSNCGQDMRGEVESLIADWATLKREGLCFIAGPGHVVELRYSELAREREEILRSSVPPLDPAPLLAGRSEPDMLLLVFNSGFDIRIDDWRRVRARAYCPVWMDIHSLALAKRVGVHRDYVPLPEWREWAAGVHYLQANRQEIACMIGRPERWADGGEIELFARDAFGLGVQAVFVTMGKDGVLVLTPAETRMITAPAAEVVVDTTGCGDVFCAAAMRELVRGAPVFEAAARGVALASRAVAWAGLRQTFERAGLPAGQS